RLRAAHPQVPLLAVGWSLGAGIVLKALGEDSERTPLSAAVAISTPFDLHASARLLRDSGHAYQFMLMRALKRNVRRKHDAVPPPPGVDLRAAAAAADFFAFGNAYTAPCNGFAD